jgi:glycosyltransferase involved in cell wall biosynthesis
MVPHDGGCCHKPVVYHILGTMRVAIDAVPLLIRSAGVKNYLYYWIQHLRRAAAPHEIRTVPALRELGPLTHEGSVAGRLVTASGLGSLALSNYGRLPTLEWMARGADVFHASSLVRNPPRRPRLTATIHDMTSWLLPELHPAANRRADSNFAELARRAHRLIAVSAATRDDAVRVLRLAPKKVAVIHSGIADAFFDPDTRAVDDLRERRGLKRPYVLFVGTIEPRKNLDTLLDAWEALPGGLRKEFELVIAGPAGWAPAATLARVRQTRYLGYVAEADLPLLTAGAEIFAYPSLYEGFGFPVAQAMAAGVPVITSNVSSLPEISGGAAVLVDPRSQAELRDALNRLLLSPSLRADLAARGRVRASQFRWENCAARSLEFFRQVIDG